LPYSGWASWKNSETTVTQLRGYRIAWSGMRVTSHFGGRQHLQGILPDVSAGRTIKGIRERRDEFLEKALGLAAK
jgi:hypothetical protein